MAGWRRPTIARISNHLIILGQESDAEEAICWHGSLALVAEFKSDWTQAIRSRRAELRKIRRLYALEETNSTDGWATQGYQKPDIVERRQILHELLQRQRNENRQDRHASME